MFKKVKKFELRGLDATERLEKMDILNGENTESVNILCNKFI